MSKVLVRDGEHIITKIVVPEMHCNHVARQLAEIVKYFDPPTYTIGNRPYHPIERITLQGQRRILIDVER